MKTSNDIRHKSFDQHPRKSNAEGRLPLEKRATILKAIVNETFAAVRTIDPQLVNEIEASSKLSNEMSAGAASADQISGEQDVYAARLARPALSVVPKPTQLNAPTTTASISSSDTNSNVFSLDEARSRVAEIYPTDDNYLFSDSDGSGAGMNDGYIETLSDDNHTEEENRHAA
ncbi:MAG TPA: hypothetical protein VF575_03090 [Candidatus Saccharimonadales bacterium]|jgi:hypothetical protein